MAHFIPPEFIISADRHRKKRPARRKKSKFERGRFCAWDSEGWDVETEQEVGLICNSAGDVLFDPDGLDTETILNYVVAGIARMPSRTHVIFAGDYDVNMWLRDLPHRKLIRLWDGEWTIWKNFKMNYRPRKSFSIHRGTWGGTLWDVFGFAQSSFVEMLKAYKLAPPEVIARIEDMKQRREFFDQLIKSGDYRAIASYCREEVEYLEKFAKAINRDAKAVNLTLTRYDGAGAAAAALLKREKVKSYLGVLPAEVEHAARFGYFGGRIELIRFGRSPSQVWKHDINSAYPSGMATLPCLCHGHWEKATEFPPNPNIFALWRVRWSGSSPFLLGPLPWRDKRGAVFFPYWGEGWYWTPELIAASANDHFRLEPLQGFQWIPDCDHNPLSFIPLLYSHRRKLKEAGIAGEKMLKLALNSLYGKFAQTAGGEKRIPPFHNLTYAGYITSATRAKLYLASLMAGHNLVALATDAVFSTKRLPIPHSKELGEWDATTYDNITTVQSGVYWLGSKAFNPSASRGFGKKSLTLDMVLNAWQVRAPHVTIRQRGFIGMGMAAQIGWEHWRTWRDVPRDIDIWQSKTKRVLPQGVLYKACPWLELIPTNPANPHIMGVPRLSAPIMRPWDTEGTALSAERQIDPRLEESLSHLL